MESNVLLEVKGISKTFSGTMALSEVDLSIRRGEVHALVGENGAGKSTLVKIIAGALPQDSGTIYMDGREVFIKNPKTAQDEGIGFVHQEFSLCPHLSVAENIYIGRLPKTGAGLVDYRRLYADCEKILGRFKTAVRPWFKVSELSLAQQQVIEIAKSISQDCKLLIFDEPTSSLTAAEAAVLFDIICRLRRRGISILYISHKIEEVFRVCDRVTVLRNGRHIGTFNTVDTGQDEIIRLMTGKSVERLRSEKSISTGDEILRVEGFDPGGGLHDIGFSVCRGEILGFTGLAGSGRTRLMRAICGIDRKKSGQLYLEGRKIEINNYSQAMKQGIYYLTEDRRSQGLFLNMSVLSNVSAASLHRVRKGMLIDPEREKGLGEKYAGMLNIGAAGLEQAVDCLSGGNQQKVMIAKCLSVNPKVIIMDEPTRGIDVGAKAEIHALVRKLAGDGAGIILVSSEPRELFSLCDRVIVMNNGSIKSVPDQHFTD